VTVLDDVSFDLRPGEVHALLGANGAGKSTLIKVLAGLVDYDSGSIEVQGERLPRGATGHALTTRGIAFVHQDLGLVDTMTVSENIALATGYVRRRGLIDFGATAQAARRATSEMGLDVDPHARISDLDQDAKVMVAVARAFALHARAVVLDEVSSSLPAPVVSRLLQAVRATTAAGLGYVYVTHRLDELFGMADRVTVLRDGRVALTALLADVDKATLVEAIVAPSAQPGAGAVAASNAVHNGGADDGSTRDKRAQPPSSEARLQVTDLRVGEEATPLTLAVRPGEIVALCGLIGCGAKDIVRVLGGDLRPHGGSVLLDGTTLPLGRPAALRDCGCSYIPGDRQAEGVVANLSIRENLFLTRRGGQGRAGAGLIRAPKAERALAAELSQTVDVRPSGSVERPMATLSGGNQQKVVCARALRTKPTLLVLDDPTAGVDIGARAQVHRLVRDAANAGAAVVFASTDYEEVALLADRALVMVHGTITAELAGPKLTEAALARASYGEADTWL
jgi:ribose transport system ATP-binding protein